MNNKVALVTGASRGIGKAIALKLAQLGYKLALVARSEDAIAELAANTAHSKAYAADLSDLKIIPNLVQHIADDFGRIDVFVNNAGVWINGSLESSLEDFQRALDINLSAGWALLKEVVPIMKAQETGYIFNVSSIAGKTGFSGTGAYSSTKFALAGLNESLYRELASFGIKVTALCPGWVNTDMAVDAGNPFDKASIIQVEDISETVSYLLRLSKGAHIREVLIESGDI